jgi:hypothetical protein
MRRLPGWFPCFAALSLLLCLASGVLLVRSLWWADVVIWSRPGSPSDRGHAEWSVGANRGVLYVERVDGRDATFRRSGWIVISPGLIRKRLPAFAPGDPYGPFNFGYRDGTFGGTSLSVQLRLRTLSAPLWAVALAFAILPAIWARRHVKRRRVARRAAEGRCAGCGYDLRATSARCPECGGRVAERATV